MEEPAGTGLIDRAREPSARELRVFGVLFAAFFGLIGALILWRTSSRYGAGAVWSAAAAVTLAYYAVPALRWPIYNVWMSAVHPIGWTISHLLLAVVFYGVVTSFGFVMRLFGRDFLQRDFDPGARTYFTELKLGKTTSRYFRQF